ncbi:Rv1355c family protein [Rhodococcus sp. NPDC127528]|uniref:Rv1355c family protein n=1 Tax=unclassified Rhodococcus (in: high G+C Gram-positive bacteria) TaxID=192944 RepID=UPI0036374A54
MPPRDDSCTVTLLDESTADGAARLAALRGHQGVSFRDALAAQRVALRQLIPTPDASVRDEPANWAYYPWRREAVRILGPTGYRMLRLDRNRNKVTGDEQRRLAELHVGIVGLSVGHAVALALALESSCGAIRLADFDTLELSNLNRVPATVFDLGVNKAVVAARRIAEIDPYLTVSVWGDGVTTDTIDRFLDGLDVVVEECDSLEMKVAVRMEARRRRLPVVMETSDRGLLDVERFDLEPDRAVFHGLLGDLDARELAGLSQREKIPHILRLLGAEDLSTRMVASLVEVGNTISSWPQLGGDVLLGGASVSAAVRRIGLGLPLPSGRARVDLDERLDGLRTPIVEPSRDPAPAPCGSAKAPDGPTAIARAATLAPSGGNAQPWNVVVGEGELRVYLDPDRTTAMDVAHRGSHVAIGAALFNARVAAAAHGLLGPIEYFGDDSAPTLVATMSFGAEADEMLAGRYDAVVRRGTNRRAGSPRPITIEAGRALATAAHAEGARLTLVTDRRAIESAAGVFAAAERIRFLEPRLHGEMVGELRWPGADAMETGIDVRSLELDDADLSTLRVLCRPDAMAALAEWGLGSSLGVASRDRIVSSSALAAVVVGGSGSVDFVRGGCAVESVWITAEEHGLAVQPISPVFLYGVAEDELAELAPGYAGELATGSREWRALFDVGANEAFALVLRLSHAGAASVRSLRRQAVAQPVMRMA